MSGLEFSLAMSMRWNCENRFGEVGWPCGNRSIMTKVPLADW